MRKIHLVIFLAIVLASLPSLTALSLSGIQLGVITYHPGTTITNHYWIADTNYPVEVMVDGAPFSDITTTEVINNEFDIVINFSKDEYIPPGEYIIGLTVVEKPDSEAGGIVARVAVSKKIRIQVYSYEKDINIGLDVPNINEGRNLTLNLGVSSVGYPDINQVYGAISVYDAQDTLLGEKITPPKPLPGLESISFREKFDSSKWPAASYKAKAVVYYDGKEKTANTSFLIGKMDLRVKDYTKQLEQGFDEFSVTVTNNWGNPLRNVYVKLIINGQELLQTPSTTMEPWQETVLKGLLEVKLNSGEYPATLQLFFEGETKDVPITITIIPKPEEIVQKEVQGARSLMVVPLLITIFIIIIILGIYFFRRKKLPPKKDEL